MRDLTRLNRALIGAEMSHVSGGLVYKRFLNALRPAGGPTPDPLFAQVIWLLNFGGPDGDTTFTDLSSYARATTRTNLGARQTAAYTFFPGQVISTLSGNPLASYAGAIGCVAPGVEANAQSWTIEFWWKQVPPLQTANFGVYFCNTNSIIRVGTTADLAINQGKIILLNGGVVSSRSTTRVDDGADYFVAITREFITPANIPTRIYINGVLEDNVNSALGPMFAGGAAWEIGRNDLAGTRVIRGYCGPIRFTAGTARYTGATCPIPTGPFPTF